MRPGAFPSAHAWRVQRESVRLDHAIGDERRVVTAAVERNSVGVVWIFLDVVERQANVLHAIGGTGPDLDMTPVFDLPIGKLDVEGAGQRPPATTMGNGQRNAERVFNAVGLYGIPSVRERRCRFPAGLRIGKVPFNRFGDVLGNLGAHDGGGIQVLLEVQRHLGREHNHTFIPTRATREQER